MAVLNRRAVALRALSRLSRFEEARAIGVLRADNERGLAGARPRVANRTDPQCGAAGTRGDFAPRPTNPPGVPRHARPRDAIVIPKRATTSADRSGTAATGVTLIEPLTNWYGRSIGSPCMSSTLSLMFGRINDGYGYGYSAGCGTRHGESHTAQSDGLSRADGHATSRDHIKI